MADMKELILGGYDMHVHSAPDVLPRKMDDIEMAERIKQSGMAGYIIKSHYFCTSERAELINKMFPDCNAIGAITLNSSVGGINPSAVEMAARSGAKLVWFPTCDSAHERAYVLSGKYKKQPYWATIVQEMAAAGNAAPTVTVLDEKGGLTEEAYTVLKVIAKYDMILATGHMSHEEAFALCGEASKMGVKNILVTHADFPTTFYTVEEQKKFLDMGAYIEHCYTTWATGKCPIETTMEQIKAIGPDHIVLATDLGQKTAIYPDEGMLAYAEKLYEAGYSVEEVRKTTVYNPKKLLGLE
ncbi:MAG: DUF6282 family protein [Clostridia bacterium]|nr:DUF6282 family protein [Clostridia bacterium]